MKEGLSRKDAEEKCARAGRTGDTHVSDIRVAHDSEDSESLKACIAWRIKEGDTEEEAREYCESSGEKVPASDSSLGIVNRDPTPLERCMGCRMDIYGETEEQARRTCSKMFNDPMFKHTFTEGKPEAMGAALFKWEYDHADRWKHSRIRDAEEKTHRRIEVEKIIEEIQHDSNDPEHCLPDICLKERAEKIFNIRQGQAQAKMHARAGEDRSTVGSLYGKTKEQIIREQAGDTSQTSKVGSLYMKTREQIIAEDEAYDQWSRHPEKKREYNLCVRVRMAEGMTRGEAEAHCLAATLPSDEPGPHAKRLREGPM